MVIPFDVITISRDVAEQMNQAVDRYCLACNDLAQMEHRFRYEMPTTETGLFMLRRQIDRNKAALEIADLVLTHIIQPNFK